MKVTPFMNATPRIWDTLEHDKEKLEVLKAQYTSKYTCKITFIYI